MQDINLDLVQFPQPVYITEVRIIPLGARVQADFPGGVRLGATNPSKFHIHLFVNDLSKTGASAFENLGDFEYNQNDCINLQCTVDKSPTGRQIPTDGLVIRGCYTTITLAVYGLLAKDNIREQISSPTPPVAAVVDDVAAAADDKDEIIPNNSVPAADFGPAADERDLKDPVAGDLANHDLASVGSVPAKLKATDSVRKYTEEWVASTGNNVNVISDPNAVPIEAKSPDMDSWSVDDDLNKTATTITSISSPQSLSPESLKRKRDLSPEYRWHRGVLDKKISKTKEYVASRGSPTTPTSRHPKASTPEFGTPTASEPRRPRTPDSHNSDDLGKTARSMQSPRSMADDSEGANAKANATARTLDPDDELSQGECGRRICRTFGIRPARLTHLFSPHSQAIHSSKS